MSVVELVVDRSVPPEGGASSSRRLPILSFRRHNGHFNGICPKCDRQMVPGELPSTHSFCKPSRYSWFCVECKCVTPMM